MGNFQHQICIFDKKISHRKQILWQAKIYKGAKMAIVPPPLNFPLPCHDATAVISAIFK